MFGKTGILFVRGASGNARFTRRVTSPTQITFRCINDNWTRVLDTMNDADIAQAVTDVAAHAQGITGAPIVVADLTAFFGV